MDRVAHFRSYAKHAWYGRLWSKCSKADIEFAEGFLHLHSHTTPAAFYMIVSRLGLSSAQQAHEIPQSIAKSKGFPLILEMMSGANQSVLSAQKEKK